MRRVCLRPIGLVLLALVFLPGCRREAPQREVWFVQATDPHVFIDDMDDDKVRLRQEALNQEAFSQLIANLDDLPGPEPAFLVVSGDFGLDRFDEELQGQTAPAAAPPAQQPAGGAAPAETPAATEPPASTPASTPTPPPTSAPAAGAAASDNVHSAVKYLVDTLGKSPVKTIYLVPGNNDVAREVPEGKEVEAAQSFWKRVQQGLTGTGVSLHDLTSCYFGEELPSGCYADVQGTSYRLIGFPSQSFKDGVGEARSKVQQAQLEKLAGLVSQAAGQGKRALIVTHIPEIDDPHTLAENEMKADPDKTKWAPGRPEWSAASPWNVPKAVYDKWREIVGSQAVAGVLAGHFHDSHKEIYRPPYDWATASAERASVDKLYLTPPLSMRYQDESPIQARGFALFRLKDGDDPERELFWYDRKAKTFEREEPGRRVRPEPGTSIGRRIAATALLYWKLATQPVDLARATVIAIAFLAAFLTIVELWEIPPPKTPLAPGTAQNAGATPAPRDFTAFTSNFVKTVLAGLGGMLVLSFLESIWADKAINARAYYIVLFVTFFFLMLISYALLQALIEALRSRILTQHPVRAWRPAAPRGNPRADRWRETRFRLSYWRLRIWDWVLSLRAFALIFFDTFSNVIRGRNQLRTVVFEKAILELHWGIVRAADRIREEIEHAILNTEALKGVAGDEDVRVSVSVLSEDESVLFYVAREQGSLARSFDKRSVAWVSVYTGVARWWREGYDLNATVLLDNTSGGFPLLPQESIRLGQYYQQRPGQDYQAFIVLPIPWVRSATEVVHRAGVQISFREAEHFKKLLTSIEAEGKPLYESWTSLLAETKPVAGAWIPDDALRQLLHQSLLVLEELFIPFNETVFDMYIRPNLRPG